MERVFSIGRRGRAAFDEGIAHLQKRDYRDAEASFKKAVQPDADSSGALAYLGVTYAAAGRDTQAANVWRTAMNGADDIPQMYEWLGESLMRLFASKNVSSPNTRRQRSSGMRRNESSAAIWVRCAASARCLTTA